MSSLCVSTNPKKKNKPKSKFHSDRNGTIREPLKANFSRSEQIIGEQLGPTVPDAINATTATARLMDADSFVVAVIAP